MRNTKKDNKINSKRTLVSRVDLANKFKHWYLGKLSLPRSIYDLEFSEEGNQSGKSIYNWAQQNVSYPRFHENSDIIHGLTICVNDTWGNTVEVKDYNFDGEHFSGTLHFCIYDHFGLDQPDVEKTYVNLAGFRAWYVLQHYDYFNGSFVPFVTLMEFDVPFESDIIMFKPGK